MGFGRYVFGTLGNEANIITSRSPNWYARYVGHVTSQKCTYHVTFDLDFDLEHTLDASYAGDHPVHVWWRSGHLPA